MAKILVVDSEPGMRQVIDKILSPQGYEIFSAEDGNQALNNCKKINPNLVLLDVRLPDMESADILAALRIIDPALPVVVLSGFGDAETAAELVKKGAFSFIHKPFKVDSLRQMVKKALNQKAALNLDTNTAALPEVTESRAAGDSRGSRLKRAVIVSVAGALVLALGGFLSWKLLLRDIPEAGFTIPYTNASGISFDGRDIWVADWADETVYRHTRDAKFSVSSNFKTQGFEPTGLAFDGKYIWISHSFGGKIYKRNVDAALSAVNSFASPGPSVSGLYFDGANLWSLDFQQGKIFKHTMDAGLTVAATYDSPAINPCGMFKFGKEFYIADSRSNKIFKVDAADFSLRGIYILPQYGDKNSHLTGIAWDGKSIWTCSDGVQKVFRYPLKSLKPLKV